MNEYYMLMDMDKVAKQDAGGGFFVWEENTWKPVKRSFVYDRLYGYDDSEPAGSPYSFGHISAYGISEEEAIYGPTA